MCHNAKQVFLRCGHISEILHAKTGPVSIVISVKMYEAQRMHKSLSAGQCGELA